MWSEMFTAIETPIHTDRTTVVEACAVKSRVSKPSARFSLETLSENVIGEKPVVLNYLQKSKALKVKVNERTA